MELSKTLAKHLEAITSGKVERTNVIGIRKAINAAERRSNGWSVAKTAPTLAQAAVLEDAIYVHHPTVIGELHESGLAVLRNRRYKNRWTDYQRSVIETACRFDLLRYERIGRRGEYAVPVYRVINRDGDSFAFMNIPWQSGGDGPEVMHD